MRKRAFCFAKSYCPSEAFDYFFQQVLMNVVFVKFFLLEKNSTLVCFQLLSPLIFVDI